MFTLIGQQDRYVEYLRHKGSTDSTIRGYSAEIRLILRHFEEVGIVEASDITEEAISVVESWLLEKKVKPSSRKKTLSVLKNYFKYLKDTGLIVFDIGNKIKSPKVSKTLREVPSPEEIKEVLASATGVRESLILSLLYYTGVRAGELASIFTNQVNLRQRSIRIIGKGEHERIVYFPVPVAMKLKKWMEQEAGFMLFPGLTSNVVSLTATKHLKRVGLSQTGAHIFRYSIATHLYEAGVNVRLIQTMLGHKELKSTYEYILPRIDYLKGIHFTYHPFQKGFL